MNTIVMNLSNGAVSEYDSGLRYGASLALSDTALVKPHEGALDEAAPIAASFKLPSTTWGSGEKLMPQYAYIDVRGTGGGYRLRVQARGEPAYTYPFTVHSKGRQRAILGRGLRANYFDFEFQNVNGSDFAIDNFDLLIAKSDQRKV